MGKKRIIAKSQEELIKEREQVDQFIKKDSKSPLGRISEGRVYIASSYNNTIMTLTDKRGNVLNWTSAGGVGFKGSKKSTPFAASRVAEILADAAKKIGIMKIDILVKGVGGGRESAIRSLSAKGLDISAIKDVTPIPHNGCRPRKVRRV